MFPPKPKNRTIYCVLTLYCKHARKEGRKEENVLFKDALNTFFIYGYMVKDHPDSERGNLLQPLSCATLSN